VKEAAFTVPPLGVSELELRFKPGGKYHGYQPDCCSFQQGFIRGKGNRQASPTEEVGPSRYEAGTNQAVVGLFFTEPRGMSQFATEIRLTE
jgi:hypothetical protein